VLNRPAGLAEVWPEAPVAGLQVLLGAVIGDGHLIPPRGLSPLSSLRLEHAAAQADYLDWKLRLLPVPMRRYVVRRGTAVAQSPARADLAWLRTRCYSRHGRVLPVELAHELGPLGLLVWYLDDGATLPGGPRGHEMRLSVPRYDLGNTREFLETACAAAYLPAPRRYFPGRGEARWGTADSREIALRWRALDRVLRLPDLLFEKVGVLLG